MSNLVVNKTIKSNSELYESMPNSDVIPCAITETLHCAKTERFENDNEKGILVPSPVGVVVSELASLTSGMTGRVAVSDFIRLLTNPSPESGAPFPRGISPKDLFDYISKLPEDQRVSKTRNHLQVLLWRDVKLAKIQRVGTGVYTVPEFYDQIMQLKQVEGSNDGFTARHDELVDANQKSKAGRKRFHEKPKQTTINGEKNGSSPTNLNIDQNNSEVFQKKCKIENAFTVQEFNDVDTIDKNTMGAHVCQEANDRPPSLVANDQVLDLSLIAKLKYNEKDVEEKPSSQVIDNLEKSVNAVVNGSQKRDRRSSSDQQRNPKRNLIKNGANDSAACLVNDELTDQRSHSDADSDSFVPIAHYKTEIIPMKIPKQTLITRADVQVVDKNYQTSMPPLLISTTDVKNSVEDSASGYVSNGKQVQFDDILDGREKAQRNCSNIVTRRKRSKKSVDNQQCSAAPEVNGNGHLTDSTDVCFFCQSNQEGLDGRPEQFLCCFTCGFKAHPTCMGYCDDLAARCRLYDWQCSDCKFCCLCSSAASPDSLMLCDECDRGYHTYCHKPVVNGKPTGKWSCKDCSSLQTKPKISPKSEIEVTKRSILIQNTVESVGCSSSDNSNQAVATPDTRCNSQGKSQSNTQNLNLPFIDDNPLIKQAAKEAHGWNVDQVFNFISQLGFADQAISFRREAINGSCDSLNCDVTIQPLYMDETVASKCIIPEPPSRKVLHLRQCLTKFTNRLAGDALSFTSIYSEFYSEIDKKRSKSEIEYEHDRLIDALKNDVKDKMSDLMDNDDVERRLNLLSSLIDKDKQDKTEKWRPSGKPDVDLRPYRFETMDNFKRKLIELGKPIENESRSLKRKITDSRKSVIDKHKLIRDRLSKLRRK